jgi:hypothetical protein
MTYTQTTVLRYGAFNLIGLAVAIGWLGAGAVSLIAAEPIEADSASTQHVVVYHAEGRFGGWPANNGGWSWGDEILVGFQLGYYSQDERDKGGHANDKTRPDVHALMRSTDGGVTWQLESPAAFGHTQLLPVPDDIDLSRPQTVIQMSMESYKGGFSRWYISQDRGYTWEGPYGLPRFDWEFVAARTDYVITGPKELYVFLTVKEEGQVTSYCARTTDGGQSWEKLGKMLTGHWGYAIMSSTVELDNGALVSAVRRRYKEKTWVKIVRSDDRGKTWDAVSDATEPLEGHGNPASLVRLDDGRLVITYGHRAKPYGIRARISRDAGKSWSAPIVLRDDATNWDLGYTRSFVRPDGKIFTAYYISTRAHYEQHIAGTIWDPDAVSKR